jgi:hypothetical protein
MKQDEVLENFGFRKISYAVWVDCGGGDFEFSGWVSPTHAELYLMLADDFT